VTDEWWILVRDGPHLAHGDDTERPIRTADQALYVAKSRGRDTIVRAVTADAEN
jgi:hypothetical protein